MAIIIKGKCDVKKWKFDGYFYFSLIVPGGEVDGTVWSAVAGDIAIPAQFEAHIKLNNETQITSNTQWNL